MSRLSFHRGVYPRRLSTLAQLKLKALVRTKLDHSQPVSLNCKEGIVSTNAIQEPQNGLSLGSNISLTSILPEMSLIVVYTKKG